MKCARICVLLCWPSIVLATYTVTSNADTGAVGTFRWAINQVNSASDSIDITAIAGQTITLVSNLPACTGTTTIINGGSAVTINGSSTYRNTVFFTGSTITGLSLLNTAATGGAGGHSDFGGGGGGGAGMGGGWFVYPSTTLTINGGSLSGTQAVGGAGGNSDYTGVDADGGGGAGGGSFCFASTAGSSATADDNGAAGGGDGGGTGGPKGAPPTSGGAGTQSGGGGGGGGYSTSSSFPGALGGAGAFGGGGGGAGNTSGFGVTLNGGAGGYGGGGGGIGEGVTGSPIASGGAGGRYAGNGGGGAYTPQGYGCAGGGGAGIGGIAFVADSATLVLNGVTSWSNGTVTGGAAGQTGLSAPLASAGQGVFSGVFLYQSAQIQFGGTCTIGFNIDSDSSLATPDSGIRINSGTVTINSTSNTYRGNTTLAGGTLNISADSTLGTGSTIAVTGNATLQLGASISSMARAMPINPGVTFTIDTQGFNLSSSGIISGATGAFTKLGSGTLTLTGANTYGSGTTVNAGTLVGNTTSLQGNISNSATVKFSQTFAGTYAGQITGGSLIVDGGGLITMSSTNSVTSLTFTSTAQLALNGTMNVTSASNITIPSGAVLQGTGTLSTPASVLMYGTLHPGNSVGTITIDGDYVQEAGSIFSIDCTPSAAGQLIATGSIQIKPGATLLVNPSAGTYTQPLTIMYSTGSQRTGEFSSFSATLPAFSLNPIYTDNTKVLLSINSIPIPDLPISSDARIAAQCIQSAIDEGSDPSLDSIYDALQLMQIDQMNRSLTMMLPTTLNLMDFTQMTALVQIRQVLSREMDLYLKSNCAPFQPIRLWSDVVFNHSQLKTEGDKVGCDANVTAGTAGLDVQIAKTAFVGGALAYSVNPIHFYDKRGSAHIYDAFAMLYAGGFLSPSWYLQAALVGSFNYYESIRKIIFEGLNVSFSETAKGKTKGLSGLTHLEVGMVFNPFPVQLRPFSQLDWMILHRDGFEEYGATGINLDVKEHNADLFRSETGVEFSLCISTKDDKKQFTPYVVLAGIFQHRFFGQTETATFEGIECPMTVKGHRWPEGLFFFETGILTKFYYNRVSLSADYSQERGHDYANHTWSFQMRCHF